MRERQLREDLAVGLDAEHAGDADTQCQGSRMSHRFKDWVRE